MLQPPSSVKYKHIVKAMNKRAAIVADRENTWKAEKSFRALLKWTESTSVSENEKEGLADEDEGSTKAGRMLTAVLFNREVDILY
ncbi:hypothetical protein HOY82DRAFT_598811 [Tuber indicum]|nr:hypothetical protein HOY82DRAFT_598811 [Tuber indicum]